MRKIEFTSKNLLGTNKQISHVPEYLYELSQDQFIYIMSVADSSNIDDEKLLSVLTGIHPNVLKKANAIEKYELGKMFDFLSEETKFVNVLIKKFVHNNVEYDAPTDFLANITFLEFVFADTYFLQHTTDQADAKYKLAATLYRKHVINLDDENFEGDTREPFSEHRLNQRADLFKTLYPAIINGILFNYHCIRKVIEQKYPFIFPQKEDEELEPKDTEVKVSKKKINCNGWAKTFQNFVDEDLINEDKYALMNAHRVLQVINDRIKESYKND